MSYDWVEIRAKYEAGASERSLAKKYGVSRSAIQKHIKAEGWSQDVSRSIHQLVEAKVAGVVAGGHPKKTAAALGEEADRRVDIIRTHRDEWKTVAGLREMALQCVNHKEERDDYGEAFARMKLAKITAEMTAIKQAGERKAYNLDIDPVLPNPNLIPDTPVEKLDDAQLESLIARLSIAVGEGAPQTETGQA